MWRDGCRVQRPRRSKKRKQATSQRGLMAWLAFDCGRGRYAFRRRKYTIPITAMPAKRARLPGSGTDSSPVPSPQWAARMAASLTLPSPSTRLCELQIVVPSF